MFGLVISLRLREEIAVPFITGSAMFSRLGMPGVLAFLALSLLTSGCGKSKGTVSGKVTYENKPVVFGIVLLADGANQPVSGVIQPDGTFTVKDVTYGEVSVAVMSPNPSRKREEANKPLTQEMKEILKDAAKQEPDAPKDVDLTKWFEIPARYTALETSDIRFTLAEKNKSFDIALKAGAP